MQKRDRMKWAPEPHERFPKNEKTCTIVIYQDIKKGQNVHYGLALVGLADWERQEAILEMDFCLDVLYTPYNLHYKQSGLELELKTLCSYIELMSKHVSLYCHGSTVDLASIGLSVPFDKCPANCSVFYHSGPHSLLSNITLIVHHTYNIPHCPDIHQTATLTWTWKPRSIDEEAQHIFHSREKEEKISTCYFNFKFTRPFRLKISTIWKRYVLPRIMTI
jgi:hypothetical protein